jgi:hypothetical protein
VQGINVGGAKPDANLRQGRLRAGLRGVNPNPTEGSVRCLSAIALAIVLAMLAAGMTEHNFGDSEFQMLPRADYAAVCGDESNGLERFL